MAAAALQEVEAVRRARLAAQEATYQMQQSQGELEVLRQQVAALEARERQRQQQCSTPQGLRCAGGPGCAAADALQEARLQAADSRYKQQLTELELAKQLDALQALQWQLDCVVAQLGLSAPAAAGGSGGGSDGGSGTARAVAAAEVAAAGPAPGMDEADHLVQLLMKVEELRHAQSQLSECQRRLAAAEARLLAQQQAHEGRRRQPGVTPPAERDRLGSEASESAACSGDAGGGGELGEGGRLLVGELLHENEALRRRLAEAEGSYRSLERDYEVELLIRADAEETAAAQRALARSTPGSPARHQRRQAGALGEGGAAEALAGSGSRRRQGPAVTQSMDVVARQRLELRLREKDAQLGKLRGVVHELEGKLIEAHKRQADLVMRESSWREQEAQDRRIAALEDEKARLEFAATAAQAEAAAARGEAAAQRRAVKRLQDQAAAASQAQAGGGGAAGAQVAELLQKRVKVLEAQNIRLRLQAKSSKEEEELAAAEAAAAEAAAAARAAASRRRQGRAGGGQALPAAERSGEGGEAAPGENDSPNREGAEGAAAAGSGEAGASVLDIPFARWEADKRLQKKVEALQGKLRDRTTALVSAEAGRRRAEEAAEQAAAAAAAAQGALAQAQAQLRQAERRAEPGVVVPVTQCRQLLLEVEELQRQYDELIRQHAALRRCSTAEGGGAAGGSGAGAGAGDAAYEPNEQPPAAAPVGLHTSFNAGDSSVEGSSWPASRSLSTLRTSSSTAYRPTDYSGGSGSPSATALPAGQPGPARTAPAAPAAGAPAPPAGADGLQAELLKRDVALLDAELQRDQAAAEAERHRRRLHALLECLSPHPEDAEAAAAIAAARQLAGLPPLAGSKGASAAGPGAAARPAAASKLPGGKPVPGSGGAAGSAGGGRRKAPSGREQELLDTIELLKGALERTKRGLESGVSSAKYMAAVDRTKALKARCAELEAQLEGAAKVREELARVQAALGAAHGTSSALRAQLKAAKDARQESGAAREARLAAQVAELERTLRERDAQMEALACATSQVDEEVRVLAAEGLRPADLIQELLVLRPRARQLEARNAELEAELAGMEEALARDVAALQADHDLLRRQAARWEGELRSLCARTGEPLPLGLG